MELRSFNVERVWREVVKVRIGNEIGVDHTALSARTPDIASMIDQLSPRTGKAREFNYRRDGEMWTPYMQIVEMLLLMGAKIGKVKINGELNPQAIVEII